MKPEKVRCETCVFYQPDDDDEAGYVGGWCQRRASVVPGASSSTPQDPNLPSEWRVFLCVYSDDWCGEWADIWPGSTWTPEEHACGVSMPSLNPDGLRGRPYGLAAEHIKPGDLVGLDDNGKLVRWANGGEA